MWQACPVRSFLIAWPAPPDHLAGSQFYQSSEDFTGVVTARGVNNVAGGVLHVVACSLLGILLVPFCRLSQRGIPTWPEACSHGGMIGPARLGRKG